MTSTNMIALYNFRDFGGVATRGGQRVAADRFYRSGQHAGLSDAACTYLLNYDFTLIADLRYPDERKKDVSPWPSDWAARLLAHDRNSGDEAPHVALVAAADRGEAAVHRAYREVYAAIPFDPAYRPLFARTLAGIARADGRVLVHCSAGKDRTGIFVALLLDLLEVPRETIAADYLLSQKSPALLAVRENVAAMLANKGNPDPNGVAAALTGVRRDYLDAMFAAVDARGGTKVYFVASGVPADSIALLGKRCLG